MSAYPFPLSAHIDALRFLESLRETMVGGHVTWPRSLGTPRISDLERLEDDAFAFRIPPRPRRGLAIGLQIDVLELREVPGPPGRAPLFLQGPVSGLTIYSHEAAGTGSDYEVAFSIFDFPAGLELSKVIVRVTVPTSREWLDAAGAPAVAPAFWPEDPVRRVHVGAAEDRDLITEEMGFGYLHDGEEPWPNQLSFVPV
jgi:hypothetical protein